MEEEQTFSLGSLDSVPDYVEQTEDNEQQEEFHPEDETEIIEESDSEESDEVEDFGEEGETEEIDDDGISYTPFLEPLIEDGILFIDENKEYEDSPEGLNEIIQDTIEHRHQEFIQSLPEDYQKALEILQAGESLESVVEVFNSFDYESVDLEDLDTQREITKDYYRDKFPNWSDTKLEKYVQNLEDLEDLKEEAEEAKNHFIEKTANQKEQYYNSIKEREENTRLQVEAELNEYNKYISEAKGFKGLEFTSNKQREDFRAYCFNKGKDGLTAYERDTKGIENRLTQAFYTFNKFGFDNVAREAKTKAVIEQKKVLARINKTDKNTTSNKVTSRKESNPSKGFSLGNI